MVKGSQLGHGRQNVRILTLNSELLQNLDLFPTPVEDIPCLVVYRMPWPEYFIAKGEPAQTYLRCEGRCRGRQSGRFERSEE